MRGKEKMKGEQKEREGEERYRKRIKWRERTRGE